MGVGFISLEMFLLYLLKIKFDIMVIILPWLFVLALNVFLMLRKNRNSSEISIKFHPIKNIKPNIVSVFLSLGIMLEVFYAFFRALIKPMESYDAVAIYAIKSKIFFLAKSIPQDYFSWIAGHFPHPDYPLNIPLFKSFIYIWLGSLNDQLVKIIFPLYFVSCLVILCFAVRRFASRNYSLAFTFILASMPQFNSYAANAYLDLPLACYLFISAVCLFDWFRDKTDIRSLILSAIMAALAGWTKNEGLMYCAAYAFVIFLNVVFSRAGNILKKAVCFTVYIFIILVILAPWFFIRNEYHLVNTDLGSINLDPIYLLKQLHRMAPIMYEFQKQVVGPKKWNIFWIAALAALLLNFKKAFRSDLKMVSITLALIICGYVYFYIASPLEIHYFLSKTWSRFLIQFLPICVYWLAMILREDVKT